MAAVTGPISTLPGHLHRVPPGQTCDTEGHEQILATHRVQASTDSMGSELWDMCQECYDKYNAEVSTQDTTGTCEFCGTSNVVLRKFRDPEEGSCGRVYDVCHPCARESLAYFSEED